MADEKKGEKGGGDKRPKRKDILSKDSKSATMRPSRPQPAPSNNNTTTTAQDDSNTKILRSTSTGGRNMNEKARAAAQHVKRSISSKLNYRGGLERQRKSVVEAELYVVLLFFLNWKHHCEFFLKKILNFLPLRTIPFIYEDGYFIVVLSSPYYY